jgi:hypothetical protein
VSKQFNSKIALEITALAEVLFDFDGLSACNLAKLRQDSMVSMSYNNSRICHAIPKVGWHMNAELSGALQIAM